MFSLDDVWLPLLFTVSYLIGGIRKRSCSRRMQIRTVIRLHSLAMGDIVAIKDYVSNVSISVCRLLGAVLVFAEPSTVKSFL